MTFKKILAWVCGIVTYIPLLIIGLAYLIFQVIFLGLKIVNVKVLYNAGYVKMAKLYAKMGE